MVSETFLRPARITEYNEIGIEAGVREKSTKGEKGAGREERCTARASIIKASGG